MSKRETLEQQRDRLMYERDQLAHAIVGAAERCGGIAPGLDLDGPRIVMLVNQMSDQVQKQNGMNTIEREAITHAMDVMSQHGDGFTSPAALEVLQGMLDKGKPKVATPKYDSKPLEVPNPMPKELVDVRWMNNAYLELQGAIYEACNRSSLGNAVTRTVQSTNPHQALMSLTHQLGRSATPNGEDVQIRIPSKLSVSSMQDMQFERYKQLSHAIDQAGKGIGLSASQPLGKDSHAEMLEFLTKIGDAAEAQIARMNDDQDDHQGPSPR
ncbi:hypothetical protein AWH63_10790 [Marinobacter sp. C18]|uniref:hypothetical protein n=1 Tax=Marinobacter sp. C18 TaxID=1772288 RepID=UPI000948B05C|nr:hypothetical protein [Marinobacter sp. C18]OLF82017.1 hypothetical protein AWH63_10790 [Marinobacter sp. C18]